MQGDKNIIKFDGDHNSSRPQFYYDSVSIFFYNVLHPPQISTVHSSKLEKYYDLGDLKVGAGMDEVISTIYAPFSIPFLNFLEYYPCKFNCGRFYLQFIDDMNGRIEMKQKKLAYTIPTLLKV